MTPNRRPLYVVLLHYPVTNRKGEVVTTSVTNMDIHDLSRTARTYGASRLYLVTPIEDQHRLVGRILDHWSGELVQQWHPDRVEAVQLVRLARDFAEVKQEIERETGEPPEVVLTDARPDPGAQSYEEYRRRLHADLGPVALVLGTGWGVSEDFYSEVHERLEPVFGPGREGGYNHLSVRSAAAVILDRLYGE